MTQLLRLMIWMAFAGIVTGQQIPVITAVVNGASFQPGGIASNTWISIFGMNLASSTRAWDDSDFVNGTLPTALDGVSVNIEMCYSYLPGYDGTTGGRNTATMMCANEPAFVEYISPTQLNVLVVHDTEFLTILETPTYAEFVMILGGQLRVTTAAGPSAPFPQLSGPNTGDMGIGTWYGSGFFVIGGNYVAARHGDGTLVGKTNMIPGVYSRPAQPGEIISLYGTGFGPVSLPAPNILITAPIALGVPGTAFDYSLSIGGMQPDVEWIGLVEAGLFQMNVTVPNLPTGDYPVSFWAGDALAFQEMSTGALVCSPSLCYASPTQAGVLISIQNQTTGSNSFAVGKVPYGVAFDGANIWVANSYSNNLMKLQPSDGTILGTFATVSYPFFMAFDGANMWVSNSGDNTVSRMRPSDGKILGTFPVGVNPHGLVFDGVNIWVANYGSQNVTKLRASDGTNLGTFNVPSVPTTLAFDGANIWAPNANSAEVTKLRASDGAVLGSFAVGNCPQGVAFDGANIWVTNACDNTVTKLLASNGANLGTFSAGTSPYCLAFDGTNMWVVNQGSNNVTKLRASDGTNLGTFSVGSSPVGVAFDGTNIWVANSNSNTVSKLSITVEN